VICVSPDGTCIEIGDGLAPKKAQAEQKASEKALETLKLLGITKFIPSEYIQFEKDNIDLSRPLTT
jgi:hypothetical protein